jgi:hypothetical protein
VPVNLLPGRRKDDVEFGRNCRACEFMLTADELATHTLVLGYGEPIMPSGYSARPSALDACDCTGLFSTSDASSNALRGLGVSRDRASSSTMRSFLRRDSASLVSLIAVAAVVLDRASDESTPSVVASELSEAFSSSMIPSNNSSSSGGHVCRDEDVLIAVGMFTVVKLVWKEIAVGLFALEALGVGIVMHEITGEMRR